jgi:diguanylate cyclase (GGDEF)-like protein
MAALKLSLRLPERLTLPWLVLATLTLYLSVLLAQEHIEQVTQSQTRQQLATDRQVIERWLLPQAQRAQATAQWLAAKPLLGDVVERTRSSDTQTWLDEAVKVSGMHWAALVDSQGEPLSSVTEEVRAALRKHKADLLAHHSTSTAITIRQDDKLVWVWLQPIEATQGGLAGQIVLGQTLDPGWRGAMSGLTRSQLTFLQRDRADGQWQTLGPQKPALQRWPDKEGPTRQANIHALPLGAEKWLVDIVPLVANDNYNLMGMALMASPNALRAPWLDLLMFLLPLVSGAFVVGMAINAWQGLRLRRGLLALARWAKASQELNHPALPKPTAFAELNRLSQEFDLLRKHHKAQEADMRQSAFKDPLTLLPNREQFCAKLKLLLKADKGRTTTGTVLMLDIQHFKHINEVLGHQNGDRLLRLLAQRLTDQLQHKHELLARVGGNRFAYLLPQVSADEATSRLKTVLGALDEPFKLDDQSIDLSGHAGLCAFPDHGLDSHALITHAELAMYTARRQHTPWLAYSPTMDANDPASLTLLSDLKQAIRQGELKLYLQPKVDLLTGQISGAEALMRWKHPTRGMVPPDRFIPFAEQSGFIKQLTLWAVEECARLCLVLRLGGLDIPLSVNLSTRDLIDKELPTKLRDIVERQGTLPQSLVLEITESATMDDPQSARRTLTQLHEMGFKLSIDDFGTGYSSLAYLKNLPVSELKIDRSFVMNMETDLNDAKIVRSTIDLAHNLGLKVVAEGLESPKAWKLLAGLKCDQAQGYLVNRPIPSDEFLAWARAWRAPSVADEHLATAFADIL